MEVISYRRGETYGGIETFLTQSKKDYCYIDEFDFEQPFTLHGTSFFAFYQEEVNRIMTLLEEAEFNLYIHDHNPKSSENMENILTYASTVYCHPGAKAFISEYAINVNFISLPFKFTTKAYVKDQYAGFISRENNPEKREDLVRKVFDHRTIPCTYVQNLKPELAKDFFDDKLFGCVPSQSSDPKHIPQSLGYAQLEAINSYALLVMHSDSKKSPVYDIVGDLPLYVDDDNYRDVRDEVIWLTNNPAELRKRARRLKRQVIEKLVIQKG